MRKPGFFSALMALFLVIAPLGAAERETIAVIGTGDLGDSLGMRLAGFGYTIVYGSRSPESERVKALVAATGNGAFATTQREAAQRGTIVFLPIPWPAMETVAQNLGNLEGKIVVDVSDPWGQGVDGYPETLVKPSSAEMIQKWNPGAKVVKGLGTMGSMIIDNPKAVDGPVTIPIASNYRDAKERIAQIVDEMGLDPVDFGPLRMAGLIETLQIIYMIPLLQRRTEEWEFYFRRNADWVCRWQDDWSNPVFDAGELARMPEKQDPLKPCLR
jgi:predicted dinucleotide-binding enzyme